MKKIKITIVIVSHKIHFINEEIMVTVELPKLAVNHIKMLIAEVSCNLIDIFLMFKNRDYR